MEVQGGSKKNKVAPRPAWTGYFVKLRDGELFEGFMVDGQRHGESRFTWADKDVMMCCWTKGRCLAHDNIDKQKKRPIEVPSLQKTRSRTAEQLQHEPEPPRKRKFFNRVGVLSSSTGIESIQSFQGQCVQCKNVCESDEHFHCMNCKAAYCKSCEQEWMAVGYEATRPPCYCVISSHGCTLNLRDTDFRQWVPKRVIGHFFKNRTAAATLQSLMLIIQFHSTESRKHTCTTICHIGNLKTEHKGYLLDQKTIRDYVKDCEPKPSVFLQLVNRWKLPPDSVPFVANTEIHQNPSFSQFFNKTRQDIDSLSILNFKLTYESIDSRLISLMGGKPQVDVGTTWSAVRPPTGYYTISGPRPVLMIYISKHLNPKLVKKTFARRLSKLNGIHFTPAESGTNVFKQSSASVDVKVLFNTWLKVVDKLQARQKTVVEDNECDDSISKMKLLRIIYHGWKSDPKCIVDPFEIDNDNDNDTYEYCKKDCPDFDVSFDIGQKYESVQLNKCIETSRMNDESGFSMLKVPVFAISGNFSGFKASTWSMFGPIAGPPMGSIMLERTDPSDVTFLPVNVTRVKVYPSIVNLTKALGFSSLNLTDKKFTCSFKQLKNHGNKISEFFATITGSDWRDYAPMLMAFRIECTMTLTDSYRDLHDLITQFKNFQQTLEKALTENTTLGLVGMDDVRALSNWCLKKYFRVFKGDSAKKFDDKILAKHVLLSALHVMGYHHFPLTQQKHARFLIDLNIEEHIIVEADKPQQEQKRVLNSMDFDWSNHANRAIMLKTLKYMNVQMATNRGNITVFRYMFRKICPILEDSAACPWCHSSTKRLKKIELNANMSRKVSKAACRSKNFQRPVDVALDVFSRLQYHIQNYSQAAERDDGLKDLSTMIEKLFCAKTIENNEADKQVLAAIEDMKNREDHNNAQRSSEHTATIRDTPPSKSMTADLIIDDEATDTLQMNDTANDKLVGEASKEAETLITFDSLPKEWQQNKNEENYIMLKDCCIDTTHFAKGNATCHLAWFPKTGRTHCMKKLIEGKRCDREKNMLEKLMLHTRGKPEDHNLIKYFGSHSHGTTCFLAFELIRPSVNFRKHVHSIEKNQVKVYMRALLEALKYLHENCSIVHRDIKPDNFVHNFEDNIFRVIDFGSARYLRDANEAKTSGGTPGYKAPETLIAGGKVQTSAMDVWSAGIIFFQLLTGQKDVLTRMDDQGDRRECDKKHLQEIGNIVGRQQMRTLNVPEAQQYGDGLQFQGKTGFRAKALQSQIEGRSFMPDDDALDLMSKMLCVFPTKRITASGALEHQFFGRAQALEQQCFNTVTGIANDTGHWCYLNSLLQCLRHTTELISHIRSNMQKYQLIIADKGYAVAKSLREFLTSDESSKIGPLHRLRRGVYKLDRKFSGETDEDPYDVCRAMLNAMQTAHVVACPNEVVRYTATPIMKCNTCNKEWESEKEQQTILKIALETDNDLQSSLRSWMRDGNTPLQEFKCVECSAIDVSRKWHLETAPNVLIVSLNWENEGSRNNRRATSDDIVQVGKHRYRIFAVISHIGPSTHSGHYIAYTETNGCWTCFNDSDVENNKHWKKNETEKPWMFFLRKLPQENIDIQSKDVCPPAQVPCAPAVDADNDEAEAEAKVEAKAAPDAAALAATKAEAAAEAKPKAAAEADAKDNAAAAASVQADSAAEAAAAAAAATKARVEADAKAAKAKADVEAKAAQDKDDADAKAKAASKGAGERNDQLEGGGGIGGDGDLVPVGQNVLALHQGIWFEAVLVDCLSSEYRVLNCDTNELMMVSKIKRLDWDYWKKKMEKWDLLTFRNALVAWQAQVGPKHFPDMGRGVEAIEYLQMGSVCAEYGGYVAYKDNGNTYFGGLYSDMDFMTRDNASVRSMQEASWKYRKNHAVTIGRKAGSLFCIDGFATTCPALDSLHNHGGMPWGALLNSAPAEDCTCELIWVENPNLGIPTLDEHTTLPKDSRLAGFLVAKRDIRPGEQLTWAYVLQKDAAPEKAEATETTVAPKKKTANKVSSKKKAATKKAASKKTVAPKNKAAAKKAASKKTVTPKI